MLFVLLQPDLPSEPEDDADELDGIYAFKRRRGCRYLAVCSRELSVFYIPATAIATATTCAASTKSFYGSQSCEYCENKIA